MGSDTASGLSLTRRAAAVMAALAIALPARAEDEIEVVETDVAVPTPDGSADAVLFHPARGEGPWPAVILWHDLGGFRPVYRDMGRKLAGEGFVVLAPNAFYRSGAATGEEVDLRDPEARARQTVYREAATDDGVARDAVAFLAFLDARSQTATGKKAGAVGYDVGASYAFRAAAAAPDRIAAVASIHGLGVATARPNSPHLLVGKTKAAYLVVLARDDDAREPGDKDDLAKAISDAGLTGAMEVYPVNHGFAVPGNPAYDPAAAERAWAAVVKLLEERLS